MTKGTPRFKDLTGVRFDYSVVLELIDSGGSDKYSQWKYLCDCGQPHKKIVLTSTQLSTTNQSSLDLVIHTVRRT